MIVDDRGPLAAMHDHELPPPIDVDRMPREHHAERLLTTRQAAAYLSCSPRTLQAWRARGGGPAFVRLSRTAVRYRVEALESWLAGRESTTEAEA